MITSGTESTSKTSLTSSLLTTQSPTRNHLTINNFIAEQQQQQQQHLISHIRNELIGILFVIKSSLILI